jgi:hypothetical protein
MSQGFPSPPATIQQQRPKARLPHLLLLLKVETTTSQGPGARHSAAWRWPGRGGPGAQGGEARLRGAEHKAGRQCRCGYTPYPGKPTSFTGPGLSARNASRKKSLGPECFSLGLRAAPGQGTLADRGPTVGLKRKLNALGPTLSVAPLAFREEHPLLGRR